MIALGSLGSACDTAIHQPIGSAECLEAIDHSDFPYLRDKVFARSCTFSTCHSGSGNIAGHLNLTSDKAFAQLVSVQAYTSPEWMRVVPGEPENSYILVKLGAVAGPIGDAGTLMPPNSEALCAEKIDAVRRWIQGGAAESPPDGGGVDAAMHD